MRKTSIRQSRQNLRQCLGAVLLAVLLLGVILPVAAQDAGRIELTSNIQTEDFPHLRVFFEPYTPQGDFIYDLQAGDIQILEDGHSRQITELNRYQPGLQITVALNAAPEFNANVNETTFYTRIQQILTGWAQTQPADIPDDFSLATNTGFQAMRLDAPAEWMQAISGYQPDMTTSSPSLLSLTESIDLATDPNPRPFMKRAILFITPLPTLEMRSALPSLADRAAQLGVQVSVWLVTPGKTPAEEDAAPLYDLVEKTGGSFFVFSNLDAVPDFNATLQPLRYVYQAAFLSNANQSGEHRMTMSIQREGFQSVSGEASYTLEIQPPNPMFLEPPLEVIRTWVMPEDETEEAFLTPVEIPVDILIEFPDGKEREIKRSVLYVNGVAADENLEPPFNTFSWSLEGYTQTGSHVLQVQVVDIAGMSNASIETLVEVIVEAQPRTWLGQFVTGQGIIVIGALLLTGVVLLLALVFTGRSAIVERFSPRRLRDLTDPVTQPVTIRQDVKRRVSAGTHVPTVPRSISRPNAPARLLRLSEHGHPMPGSLVLINKREMTFGSDPQQAICVLDSPSVEPVHARLVHQENGNFILTDSGSVAGTWANYAPVTGTGVRLEHGDLIHFGRVAFRFELSQPVSIQRPKVTTYNR